MKHWPANEKTKLKPALVRTVFEPAPKALFWDQICVAGFECVKLMIGLLKKLLPICQSE